MHSQRITITLLRVLAVNATIEENNTSLEIFVKRMGSPRFYSLWILDFDRGVLCPAYRGRLTHQKGSIHQFTLKWGEGAFFNPLSLAGRFDPVST